MAKSVLVGRVIAAAKRAERQERSRDATRRRVAIRSATSPTTSVCTTRCIDLFRVGIASAVGERSVAGRGAAPGRGACAARAAGRLLERRRGRDRRRRTRPPRSSGAWPVMPTWTSPSRIGRVDPRSGSGPAGSDSGAADRDRPAGQGVPVPRLQLYGVHRRAPHSALGRWWRDEPGQSGHPVRPAPPGGARAGLVHVGRRRRRADVHEPARAADAVGALADVATSSVVRWPSAGRVRPAATGRCGVEADRTERRRRRRSERS